MNILYVKSEEEKITEGNKKSVIDIIVKRKI